MTPSATPENYTTLTDVTRTDRNPNQSWRYLRLVGTQSFDLVDYVALAGRRRENVEARLIRREHRGAAGASI